MSKEFSWGEYHYLIAKDMEVQNPLLRAYQQLFLHQPSRIEQELDALSAVLPAALQTQLESLRAHIKTAAELLPQLSVNVPKLDKSIDPIVRQIILFQLEAKSQDRNPE